MLSRIKGAEDMRKERNTAIVLLLTLILITLVILCVLLASGRLDTVGQSEEEKQTTVMEEMEQEDFTTENSTHSPKETVDDFSNPEDAQKSESADLPPKEEKNDDATLEQEKEKDSSQTMKRVDVSCTVQGSETGIIEGETIELSLEVPADWIQSDTGTMFYHEDGSKAAEGFWATIIPEGQTIWSTAKVDLVPTYISSKIVNINGQEVLLSIDLFLWDKNEEEPPEDQKEYCYNYYIPYQDMYITIQIYAVGKYNEEAMQLHREILESISFFSDQKEKSPQTPSVSKKTEEEIQNIANEAFEVWKALDQRIWMIFSDRDDLTLSNLIDIYSRYCMNTPEKENLITITEENATEEMKNLRGTFFKAQGFQEFSKNYFAINIKDFTTKSPSYCSELDAYSLSPTPPIPIEILMKDYSTNGSQINLIVEYNDDEYHSYQECCVTVVMTEEGFYFDSCELLYNSEE